MIAKIYITGVIGATEDTSLLDVIRQFKSYDSPSEVEVIIDSYGGNVDEGKAVFNFLRNQNLPVTTVARTAYSIASYIFFAGDKRLIEANGELMIHNPWIMEMSGEAKDLEKASKELRALEKEFNDFYSSYVNIDSDTIGELLSNETYLDATKSLELNFATGMKETLKAVAYYNPNNNKNSNMNNKQQKNFFALMSDFFKNENTPDVVALILQDENGDEVNFPDLEIDTVPTVGDKAVDSDGKAITGERIMPQLENATVVFDEAGVITEIKPVETEEDETEDTDTSEDDAVAFDEAAFLTKVIDAMESKFSALKKVNEDNVAEINAQMKLLSSDSVDVKKKNVDKTKTKTNNSGLSGSMAALAKLNTKK